MSDLKHSHITEKIIGAAFKVHNTLGNGFQEVIYQRALAIELGIAKLNFMREFEMPIFYLDQHIGTRRVDFLVEDIISVELKAIIKLEFAGLIRLSGHFYTTDGITLKHLSLMFNAFAHQFAVK